MLYDVLKKLDRRMVLPRIRVGGFHVHMMGDGAMGYRDEFCRQRGREEVKSVAASAELWLSVV